MIGTIVIAAGGVLTGMMVQDIRHAMQAYKTREKWKKIGVETLADIMGSSTPAAKKED